MTIMIFYASKGNTTCALTASDLNNAVSIAVMRHELALKQQKTAFVGLNAVRI